MSRKRTYFMYPWDWESRKQFLNLPFPMEEYEQRVQKVKKRMEDDQLDALFLYGDVRQYGYIRWLTNFYPQLGQSMVVVVPDEDPILVTTATAHGEPMHSFVPETWVRDVRIGLFHDLPAEDHPTLVSRLQEVIREQGLDGNARIGIVGKKMLTYDVFSGLMETVPDVEWVDWGHSYEAVRAVKSEREIEIYREGAKAADHGFRQALHAAKPGVTELEIAGELEKGLRSAGMEVVSNLFDTRVGSGPRSILKNAIPTNRKLQKGDALYIDISAQYRGYCIDVSTSHVVEADPTPEQLTLYETAARMTEAMIEGCKPGVAARELVEVTRAIAEENGLGEYFIEYIVGHGMGATQLEMPHFNPDSDDVLAEGMVFALEPMVVDPNLGTGTIERICMVGPNGGELLSELTLRPWTKQW